MDSEIATMKFISQSTDIAVPRAFGHNTSMEGNPVGLPFMLMECIQGNMLYDLGGPDILTQEEKNTLRKSIAAIQCQMANATLTKLGSLTLKSEDDVDIGPLPAQFGFKGPFESIEDYFLTWATLNKTFEGAQKLKDPKLVQAAESFPCRLKALAANLSTASPRQYPILHPDFHFHNILLDDNYGIVGVIDWEFAHSVPMEIFAARTSMYTSFSSVDASLDLDDEGRDYVANVSSVSKMSRRLIWKHVGNYWSVYAAL